MESRLKGLGGGSYKTLRKLTALHRNTHNKVARGPSRFFRSFKGLGNVGCNGDSRRPGIQKLPCIPGRTESNRLPRIRGSVG